MTETHSILIAVAIVVLSLTLLTPFVAHPTEPTVLLISETVTLTEDDYERQYTLTLCKGDQLKVKVSTRKQPVDLIVTQGDSSSLLDLEGQPFYDLEWTVPEDGPYTFTLIADVGNADTTITIAKK